MRPLIKINQTYRELAGAIAAAITRSGTKLFHHNGSFYTEDFKLLSPERFTTWLPQHTGLALAGDRATARRILTSQELTAISTPYEPVLPLTASQLEDLALCIASKIQH